MDILSPALALFSHDLVLRWSGRADHLQRAQHPGLKRRPRTNKIVLRKRFSCLKKVVSIQYYQTGFRSVARSADALSDHTFTTGLLFLMIKIIITVTIII